MIVSVLNEVGGRLPMDMNFGCSLIRVDLLVLLLTQKFN